MVQVLDLEIELKLKTWCLKKIIKIVKLLIKNKRIKIKKLSNKVLLELTISPNIKRLAPFNLNLIIKKATIKLIINPKAINLIKIKHDQTNALI